MARDSRRLDNIGSPPQRTGLLLYFTSQDGKLYCARIKHEAVIWSYDAKAQIETSPRSSQTGARRLRATYLAR